MDKVKCSLCPQEFDKTEKLAKIQMETHEEFHAVRICKVRGYNGQVFEKNVNTVQGQVEWIPV